MLRGRTNRFRIGQASFGSTLAVAASLLALPAMAQVDASGEGEPAAGESNVILVTAEFREQNLQDTPLAITAVTAETLEARGQTNVRDIAAHAPNVSIDQVPAGYGAAAQVTIRGIGQWDSSLALEPGVGVYIDDVYYSTVFGNVFDLLDLERVEILRGPQGTLAGKNSIGGAIKLFAKKPGPETDGYLEATYGSYNLASIKGAASFTIVPDQLWARFSGSFKHRDGYTTQYDYACLNPGASNFPVLQTSANDCVLGHEGGGNDVSLRGALRWAPGDSIEVNIAGDFSNFDDEPTPNSLVLARNAAAFPPTNPPTISPSYVSGGTTYEDVVSPDPYTSYATYLQAAPPFVPPRGVTLQAWGVSGTIDVELSDDILVKSITAYRDHGGSLVHDADASPFSLGLTHNPISIQQFTQELRLNANIADVVELTVGGFYFDGQGHNWGRALSLPLEFELDDTVLSTNYSAFAHAVWAATDRLNVTGGVRYSKEKKRFTFGRVDPTTRLPICAFGACAIDGFVGVTEAERVDYRAVVDYRWSDALMTYVQFSTGFKGGGVNPRPYYQNQVAPFGPESIDAWEAGLKADLFDRTVRLNLAAFYNKYKDIQIRTQTPWFNPDLPVQENPALPNYNPIAGTFPAAVIQNVAKADVKGVEAELTYDPGNGLLIDATVSYLDFKYVDLDPTSTAYLSGIRDTYITPYTPTWKASMGVQYEADLGNAGSLTPRVDYSYQSEMWTNAVNTPFNHLEPRHMVNARLTYKTADDDWELALAVTNVTGETYYTSLFDLYNIAGYVTGVPVRPREWSVTVKRRF